MSSKPEAGGDIQVHNSNDSIDRKPEEPHYVDPKDEKRLLKKLDRTLIPFLSIIYLLSFLDRSNVGNAKLAGLEKDLHMTGKYDYNTAVSIFFPLYVASEIPSNIIMKRFRPSLWIPTTMVVWGAMTVALGFVKNWGGLLAVRSLLGMAEGGLFPGITYYISLWYKRHECGLRMAIFFSAATAAGAVGGLLARGLMELDGAGHLAGWSWIFILEGLVTVLVAFAGYWIMYDYPATAKFLTDNERETVITRLKDDAYALSDEFKWQFVFDAFKDWKIWVHMFITIGNWIPLYSISIFLPTIVQSIGFTNEVAQLMTVPPYIVACICTVGSGFLADRHGQRGIYMLFFIGLAMLGFLLLAVVEVNAVKYFACFLVTSGIYPVVSQGVAWNGNNIGGSLKRGVGIGMHVAFGASGGSAAGFVIRNDDGPRYFSGHLTLLGTTTMSFILSIFMTIYLRQENARRDAAYKDPATYTQEEKLLETETGDNATFFRYTV